MFAELADVVRGAVDEARLASAHEVEAEHIEARCVDDSAIVAQAPLAIKHRQVQPPKIRMKARRPKDRADVAVGQIELQRRLGCDLRWRKLLGRLGWPYALERREGLRGPAVDRVQQTAELEIRQLHEKLDHLLQHQWERLMEIQQIQIELMNELTPGKRRG